MTGLTIDSYRFRDGGGNWLLGKGRYDVQAKCFSIPSGYGHARDRRISILQVNEPGLYGQPVFQYDRGETTIDVIDPTELGNVIACLTAHMGDRPLSADQVANIVRVCT